MGGRPPYLSGSTAFVYLKMISALYLDCEKDENKQKGGQEIAHLKFAIFGSQNVQFLQQTNKFKTFSITGIQIHNLLDMSLLS